MISNTTGEIFLISTGVIWDSIVAPIFSFKGKHSEDYKSLEKLLNDEKTLDEVLKK